MIQIHDFGTFVSEHLLHFCQSEYVSNQKFGYYEKDHSCQNVSHSIYAALYDGFMKKDSPELQ